MQKRLLNVIRRALTAVLTLYMGATALAQNLKPVPQEQIAKIKAIIPEKLGAVPKDRKILVFWRCEGYVHGTAIAYSLEAFKLTEEKYPAYKFDYSREYADLSRETLKKYDALILNNTTHLNTKDNVTLESDLIDFVQSGKGLVVIHAGADNFYQAKAAAEMVGGLFAGHPWGAGGTWAFKLDDPDHPINSAFPQPKFKWSDKTISKGKEMNQERQAMVEQLRNYYKIKDQRVLDAMSVVRRHLYFPEAYRARSSPYGDHPAPIGYNQTISQPYIVAYMTQCLNIQPGERVLEIGAGSGYQAAVLAEMGAKVYSVEIVPELAEHARQILAAEGYTNAHILAGDGYKGWAEHAPYDAVIVACAPEELPKALVNQLKENGRMILPLGSSFSQRLVILRKAKGKIHQENDLPVRFVPMVHGESS
ncbi:MAG: protein-L-isoaspartate(D-aspartate) O-methyltransferase [Kiritimatiellia bacterium]